MEKRREGTNMRRRRFLAGTAAFSAVLVAGCGGPEDGDDEDGGGYDLEEPDGPADRNDDRIPRRDDPSDRSPGVGAGSDSN